MEEEAQDKSGFFARWSQRKAEFGREGGHLPEPAQDPEPIAGPPASEPEAVAEADLPPIESLSENSDYSGFLGSNVSEELRRLALRKLFAMPKFNLRDGLDDYDGDYRSFEKLGDVVTAHAKRQLERQAEIVKRQLLEGDQDVSPEEPESERVLTAAGPDLAPDQGAGVLTREKEHDDSNERS